MTFVWSSIMCISHWTVHGHSSQVGKCSALLTPTGVRVDSRTTCNQTRPVSAAETSLLFLRGEIGPLASRTPCYSCAFLGGG